MKKLVILFLIFTCSLYAFDEREVLLKQANRLVARRQYEKAINIYVSLLEDYPDDHIIIEKLILNLLRISKIGKAEKILEDKKNILSGIEYVRLKTSILLLKGEIKQAYKFCKNFLNENSRRMNYYKVLANIFEQYRQYEYAIEILKQARKIANDNHLHTKELAFNYQNLKDYKNAIFEYLKLLEHQSSYYNFVLNRLKKILQEDSAYITTIEKSVRKTDDKKIQEIYALCLAEIGEYEKALKEYETLDSSKLKDFGDRLVSTGNLDTAISAYEIYLGKIREPYLISDIKIKLAEIYITQGQLDKAKEVLLQVYEDSSIKGKKYRHKTRANRFCRELLAEILLKQNAPKEEVLKYLDEAKTYAFNRKEKNEIEFKIIHFQIMNEQYSQSKEKLSKILKKEDTSSDIYKLGYYYSFLLALMQNDPAADSLLGELLINLPENYITNDALFLSVLGSGLDGNTREDFLLAYRKKLLFKDEKAIEILMEIYNESQNEEMLILAGEWAIGSNKKDKAVSIFSHDYSNELLAEYALLQKTRITQDKIEKAKLSTDFLKLNPQSVFSPEFRKLLEN
ncbi:MAG: hypothetical protein KAU01_09930 [Candidatus Cloacimonetes bacterium]|nr:hypothetical protein [Candidatus Cloacimonadota bacterium]